MVKIQLSQEDLRQLISAMHYQILDTEGYQSGNEIRPPKPEDECCKYHEMLYDRDQEIAKAMSERHQTQTKLLRNLEALERQLNDISIDD